MFSSLQDFQPKFCINFSHAQTSSSHCMTPKNIWRKWQIMELLIMSASCNFIPLIPLLQVLLSFLYLNMKNQVPHPYKTAGKIIIPYILVLTFSDFWQEDTKFWPSIWWRDTNTAFNEVSLHLLNRSFSLLRSNRVSVFLNYLHLYGFWNKLRHCNV